MIGWLDLGFGWWQACRGDVSLHVRVEDGQIVEAKCFAGSVGRPRQWKAR